MRNVGYSIKVTEIRLPSGQEGIFIKDYSDGIILLHCREKFFNYYTGARNKCFQSSFCNFMMVWDRESSNITFFHKNNMTTLLPCYFLPKTFEYLYYFPSTEKRKFVHYTGTSILLQVNVTLTVKSPKSGS